MIDPYSGNWGRIVRPGGSGMPRPMGSGLAGRMVRPMGNARGCNNQWVTHRYYSATGAEIWRADHGSIVRAIAVDSSGNVYTAGGRTGGAFADYCLAKWSSAGKFIWGIPAGVYLDFRPPGYDVAVDSAGNIWVARENWIEKYSTSGTLLLSIPVDDHRTDPYGIKNDTVTYPELPEYTTARFVTSRRLIIANDVVFFGSHFNTTIDPLLLGSPSGYTQQLSGSSCDLNGENFKVWYSNVTLPQVTHDEEGETTYDNSTYNSHIGLSVDASGNVYASTIASINTYGDPYAPTGTGKFVHVISADDVYSGDLRPEDTEPYRHAEVGYAEADFAESEELDNVGAGGIAVHQSSGAVLVAWGPDGTGSIKQITTMIPDAGLETLDGTVPLVTDATAGHNGVLAVNDNHRYVYGINAVGATIRVRDYPNTFLWQADHKTEVNDAIIKADNTVLIGGERVYDDCVPVGLAAVAGCTNTGIVTVYEIDGSVRWSKTLLTSTSANHDVCFDTSGGIWARNGDGSQLVHTDPTGIILTDVDIGSVSGQPSAPAIAFSAGGLAYCNQPDVVSDSPYQVAVAASGPLLTPGGVFHLTEKHIGITNAGKVVAWDGDRYGIYAADGTLEYYGDFGNVVLGFSNLEAAAVSPTGDYLYWLAYSTFYSKVYLGTINLNTGVVGGGTDTLLTNVTAAWCTPSGTPYYGATSLSILPSSSFPSNIYKISGGTNRIVVAAGGKLELWTFALGNYSRNWTKSVSSVSCDYFRG